jgi:hypothetical protein
LLYRRGLANSQSTLTLSPESSDRIESGHQVRREGESQSCVCKTEKYQQNFTKDAKNVPDV